MLINLEKVEFRNFRESVSKKTGEKSQYIDLFDRDSELTLSSKSIDLSVIAPLTHYKMSADIQFKRYGSAMYAVLNQLSLTDLEAKSKTKGGE